MFTLFWPFVLLAAGLCLISFALDAKGDKINSAGFAGMSIGICIAAGIGLSYYG